jgi:hypothetical protein
MVHIFAKQGKSAKKCAENPKNQHKKVHSGLHSAPRDHPGNKIKGAHNEAPSGKLLGKEIIRLFKRSSLKDIYVS